MRRQQHTGMKPISLRDNVCFLQTPTTKQTHPHFPQTEMGEHGLRIQILIAYKVLRRFAASVSLLNGAEGSDKVLYIAQRPHFKCLREAPVNPFSLTQ